MKKPCTVVERFAVTSPAACKASRKSMQSSNIRLVARNKLALSGRDICLCAVYLCFSETATSPNVYPPHPTMNVQPSATSGGSSASETYPLVKYAAVRSVYYAITDERHPQALWKKGGIMLTEVVPGECTHLNLDLCLL
ncbi:hypothetical protein OH76DRAFT_539358 [Lentinus brumalis]|uniref:Uncharacterized protein n=1 Tax=Lentinus brumalis TaxID=2498619 RepID=A0A371CHH5_9APHY|nr:hypothetical protein OH76DRAFT_539358 [Polyporus brumalis]